jgi:hypothetical protein
MRCLVSRIWGSSACLISIMCMDAFETCWTLTHKVIVISGGWPVEVLPVVVSMCEWGCQCFTASVSHHAWEGTHLPKHERGIVESSTHCSQALAEYVPPVQTLCMFGASVP